MWSRTGSFLVRDASRRDRVPVRSSHHQAAGRTDGGHAASCREWSLWLYKILAILAKNAKMGIYFGSKKETAQAAPRGFFPRMTGTDVDFGKKGI